MALLRLVFALSLLAGCSSPSEEPGDRRDVGEPVDLNARTPDVSDAGGSADLDSPDAGADGLDTGRAVDGGEPDASAEPTVAWLRFETNDGATFEGELVAVYDTARWWNPGDGLLYGVFDPSGYAPYPNDRSFRFVWARDIASSTPVDRPENTPDYRTFLRQREIVFQRPPLSATSYVITGNESYHLEEDGFGDFAWDVERTDEAGRRFTGFGVDNADYFVWDEPVLSGVAGEVIEVVSSGIDNEPGSHPPIGTAVNNLVGIALGGSFYAYYLHFREDGVDPGIVVGTPVSVGDELGRAGNSGVSLEPHIHVVLLWYDAVAERSYAVPAEFADVQVAPTPTGPFTSWPYVVPETGDWLRNAEP